MTRFRLGAVALLLLACGVVFADSIPFRTNLDMGGHKVTNLGAAVAGSDAVRLDQIPAGISGSGTAGQATYWTGAAAISGDANYKWDATNHKLTILGPSAGGINGVFGRATPVGTGVYDDVVFGANAGSTTAPGNASNGNAFVIDVFHDVAATGYSSASLYSQFRNTANTATFYGGVIGRGKRTATNKTDLYIDTSAATYYPFVVTHEDRVGIGSITGGMLTAGLDTYILDKLHIVGGNVRIADGAAVFGPAAETGTAGFGKIQYKTSTGRLQYSENGSAFANFVTGTGTSGHVATWGGTDVLSQSSNITYSNNVLILGEGGDTGGAIYFPKSGATAADWRINAVNQDDMVFQNTVLGNSVMTLAATAGGGVTVPGGVGIGTSAAGVAAVVMTGGVGVAVSASDTGRIIYNETTDKLRISENAGAYSDIAHDDLVCHLAGTETVTGAKTFSGGINSTGGTIIGPAGSAGARALQFSNSSGDATLTWTPTASHSVTMPAASGTIAYDTTTATGDILYRASGATTGILTPLAIGTSAQVLGVSSGIPAWRSVGASGLNLSDTSPSGFAGYLATAYSLTTATTALRYFAEDGQTIGRWVSGLGTAETTAQDSLVTVSSYSTTTSGGTMCASGSAAKFYIAAKFKTNKTPSGTEQSEVGILNGAGTQTDAMGVFGSQSTTVYKARLAGTGNTYLTSTIPVSTAFHVHEMWCDGTNCKYRVDGETAVSTASTNNTTTSTLRPWVHQTANACTLTLDWAFWACEASDSTSGSPVAP